MIFYIMMIISMLNAVQALCMEYTYEVATPADGASIVALIGQHVPEDRDKIVLLPKKFRAVALSKAIEKNSIFIARQKETNAVVAYKKCYVMNSSECSGVLTDEIRCSTQPPIESGYVMSNDPTQLHPVPLYEPAPYNQTITYLYNGADFTHPDFRQRGINHALTDYAFAKVIGTLSSFTELAMVYGLTNSNAGTTLLSGRTPAIVQSFIKAITSSMPEAPFRVTIARYSSYMPTFDEHAGVCAPLPDSAAVPGYGYMLNVKKNS